jgi:UDP-3-O-[3-hydroxymyristoyl] glucosamine N-acyltransferase
VTRALTLNELAALFEGTVLGDGRYGVVRTAAAQAKAPGHLVLVETVDQFAECAAARAAVVASPSLALQRPPNVPVNGVVCAEPRLHFHAADRLLEAYDDLADADRGAAWISPDAEVDPSARLGSGCVVQAGARIEAHAALFPGVVVECGALVGAGCIVRSRAVIGRDAAVAPLCEIGSGSVIGAEPQQFEAADGVWTRAPGHTRVRLGRRVAVGANTVIESGARRETIVESDVLIGGQVYIAHDCHIERGVLIIGQSGLASGVRIEAGAALMGRVAVDVDVRIGANALVLATSGVTKDVPPGARVWGNPARARNEALRTVHRGAARVGE